MKKIDTKPYLIFPSQKVFLSKMPTDGLEFVLEDEDKAKKELKSIRKELRELQKVLYAENKHKVLIVLQAMDTAGKDSTIRQVFGSLNPQGVKVHAFGKPTEEELEHDYLWRIHDHTPRKGEIAVFNRSHYEDVLVVRVCHLVKQSVWSKRFEHINQFEKMLTDEGVTILKFFLHISKDEQRQRLQDRIDVPEKRWKFRMGDLDDRKLWSKYMKAYEDVLSKTSQTYAPWHVVPANHKPTRNLIISNIVRDKLKSLKMKFPPAQENIEGLIVK